MSKNAGLIAGVMLIGAGILFYRRSGGFVGIGGAPRVAPLGTGSMPGSVGSGNSQVLGGLLGNLLSPKNGGGTTTGAPVTQADQLFPISQDEALQNSAAAADPLYTFDPTNGDLMQQMADSYLGAL